MQVNTCLLIGGDKRHQYLAKLLAEQGIKVYCYGMEQGILLTKSIEVVNKVPPDIPLVILPIPITKDRIHIFTPYSDSPIAAETLWKQFKPNQLICGGLFPNEVMATLHQNNITVFDYGLDESFVLNNAYPTAEGAIELAMHNTPYTLNSASVCVVGYGRIGKLLVKQLLGLGCQVTATARKARDLQDIRTVGAKPFETSLLSQAPPFDIMFNTVPAMVLNASVLANQKRSTLFIDLASKPGGIDFDYANQQNLRTIHALSLPAVCAPQTAAQNVWISIRNYITEKEA